LATSLDEKEVYDDLKERDLETVLPPSCDFATKMIQVLKGEFKGE